MRRDQDKGKTSQQKQNEMELQNEKKMKQTRPIRPTMRPHDDEMIV